MKITAVADELYRIAEEFGDLEAVIPDQLEAAFRNPVDRVERDAEHGAVLLVSDR